MGRKVAGFQPGGRRAYIIKAFDNRADPDPLTVTIRDPTEAEKRRMVSHQTKILRDERGAPMVSDDGSPVLSMDLDTILQWQLDAIRSHVVEVSGYTVRDIEITDGDTLAEHGETEIIGELALEILSGVSLDEDQKKHSRKRSGSKRAGTSRSRGTVKGAKPKGSPSGATATREQIETTYM